MGVSDVSQRPALNSYRDFLLLPPILVAFSYLSSIGHSLTMDLKLRAMIWVSSATCDILMTLLLIGIPSIYVSASIRRVSPSAIIRNASGEKGHSCGTPRWMVKSYDRLPFTLTLLLVLGGECGCDSIAAIMI
jgi:hypothetical protein